MEVGEAEGERRGPEGTGARFKRMFGLKNGIGVAHNRFKRVRNGNASRHEHVGY